ncbi:hypothetical protein ACFC5Z_05950 [Streptomyces sp. NPDC056004]|uniref:hypothetical protein n=1 Tax=Streptomyces sp. NPDC056004 TaxID=3345677 RepID=UPI0035E316A7
MVSSHRATFLEETYVENASRWHRLTRDNIETVRARLAPRAQLAVWPDLFIEVEEAVAALPDEGTVEILWEDVNGRINATIADETQFGAATLRIAGARSAAVVPVTIDERHPLFTAVLPDIDGTLRARWQTEPTPPDSQPMRCGSIGTAWSTSAGARKVDGNSAKLRLVMSLFTTSLSKQLL